MPRKLRFAPPGYNLHITQRGNYRQRTFFEDRDYLYFLNIVANHAAALSVDVLAYCLMPNHFHLILQGHQEHSISRFMQILNGRYAQYIHGRLVRQGRFWQTRFYSCVLSNPHLVAALRYVELNPVRANIVDHAASYAWSSARIHAGQAPAPAWMNTSTFNELFTPPEWQTWLAEGQPDSENAAIRRATNLEIPIGTPAFIERLEATYNRRLQPQTAGRRPNSLA